MKRAFLIVFCIVLFLPSFLFIASATVGDVVIVNSALPEPVPSVTVSGSTKTYNCYFVLQTSNRGTQLYHLIFDLPSSETPILYLNGYGSWYIWISQSASYVANVYDVIDGSLTSSNNMSTQYVNNVNQYPDSNHLYAIRPRNGYFPAQEGWVSNTTLLGCYYYMPDDITVRVKYTAGYYPDFVNWAPDILPVNTYRSFVSEPVCDDLNRYFVLAGEDYQYLFAIRYYLQEYQTLLDTLVNDQFYAMSLLGYMAPYLKLNDSGLSLSLYCDPTILSLVNAQAVGVILSYDIHIACYDLSTGQYISSTVFDNLTYGTDTVDLNISLGSASDYDSIQTYGVYYRDDSTSLHYNLLSCVWSQDPAFLAWRDEVITYLDNIYNLLNQSAEDVTIDADMSAIEEGQSAKDALKVTDVQGSEVDAAQQVEVAFSEAAQGFGDLSDSVTGINGLIQRMFFQYPIVLLPVIVALALGLLVTILGKNKSD